VASAAARMSSASCSTQPGCGKCWGNSRYAIAPGRPSAPTARVRTPVVPASSARTTATSARRGGERGGEPPSERAVTRPPLDDQSPPGVGGDVMAREREPAARGLERQRGEALRERDVVGPEPTPPAREHEHSPVGEDDVVLMTT